MIETENQLGSRADPGLGQYEEAAATITDGNGGGGNGTDGNGGSAAVADATTPEDTGEESIIPRDSHRGFHLRCQLNKVSN